MIGHPSCTIEVWSVESMVKLMKRLIFTVALALLWGSQARSDYDLARAAYERGDYQVALAEFQKSAESGEVDSQFNLGMMYYHGQGAARDYTQAEKWFREAARHDHPQAQFSLGLMYAMGQGVTRNDKEALAWYERAANQGLAEAQNNMGVIYERGERAPRDYVKAYMWFELAAAQGDELATENKELIEAQLAPEELERAKRSVESWKPRLNQVNQSNQMAGAVEPQPDTAKAGDWLGDETITSSPSDSTDYWVQLASFRKEKNAIGAQSDMKDAQPDLFGTVKMRVLAAELGENKDPVFRLRAGPLLDEATATALCTELKSRNIDCLVVAP